MLRTLISRYPMKLTRAQLATLANLSPRSGSYSRYLRLLKDQDVSLERTAFVFLMFQVLLDPTTAFEALKRAI
jgi:hypothetical protein